MILSDVAVLSYAEFDRCWSMLDMGGQGWWALPKPRPKQNIRPPACKQVNVHDSNTRSRLHVYVPVHGSSVHAKAHNITNEV